MNVLTIIRSMIRKSVIRNVKIGDNISVKIDMPNAGLVNAEYIQHAGIVCAPVAGTECVVISMQGKAERQVVIATASKDIPVTLAEGDTVLHSVGKDSYVHCKADGSMDVLCEGALSVKALSVSIESQTVSLVGNLAVNGSIAATGTVTGSNI